MLNYHGGPIVLIGPNEDGNVEVRQWPPDAKVSIDPGTLNRIAPLLDKSILLCECNKGELYVWGAIDLAHEQVISMFATELTAQALQLRVMEWIRTRPRSRISTETRPKLDLVIVRPTEAFPLSRLGKDVTIRRTDDLKQFFSPYQLTDGAT